VRILFLASDPGLGPEVPFGDSIRVALLIDAFRELGHEVEIRWSGPAPKPGPVALPPSRPLPEGARQLLRDVRELRRSRRFRRRLNDVGRPDLVFEFAAYLAPVGLSLAKRLGVPYVVEVEGPLADLRYERGTRGLRPVGDALERRRLAGAAALVTISAAMSRQLVRAGAAADRTFTVPNVVDAERFRSDPDARAAIRRRLGIDDRIVVGFHGVFSPWYGLDVLVDALAAAAAPRLALLLVGDGVERKRVERLVREHGVEESVTITGFVPHSEVPAYVDAFDVAVVPDHVWWTSPLKLFEYGAMGKPVVAARVPSVEAVAGDDEVLFVEPRSVAEIAAAVKTLADDAARRAELGRRWSERVAAEYGRPQLVQRLAEALQRAQT
jgi:glycosyltransferase involved in cell wall biosynthesis